MRWALLVLCIPGSAAADGFLVASNAEDTLTLHDAATLRPVARFPTGSQPHEVAVSPDQRFAYVANAGTPEVLGHTITVVDLARREVAATWDLGAHQPHDLRVSRDGEVVWAACGRTRAVLEIDADDGSVARTFETGVDGGWMLTAAPDDGKIFVAHLEAGAVSIIDRATGKILRHTIQPGEMGMDVAPDGAEVWVASVEKNLITVLEGDRVGATFPSGGEAPTRIRFTPDGRRVLVAHRASQDLVMFDRARRAPIARIPLPAPPKILTVSGDGKRAFLTSPPEALAMVVDLGARRVATIPVGKTPDGIAWIGEPGPTTARVAFTLPEADLIPEGIAHDARTGTFYVSSTYKRKIVAVPPSGGARDFTTEAQDGLLGVVGMKVDPARRVLWAAAGDAGVNMPMKGMHPDGDGQSGVWKYDLVTGKLLLRHLVGAKEKRFLNDLVIDARGDVYLSESRGGTVFVVRDGELQRWLPDGSLPGANGIALSDDGSTLYVSLRGGIATVDVASRRIGRVAGATTFADGLYLHRGSLVTIQPWAQGRVVEAHRLAGRDRVAATRVVSADHPEHLQPTTGVVVGDELFYIANSQLQRFRALHQPDGSFPMRPLRPVVVLRVRL